VQVQALSVPSHRPPFSFPAQSLLVTQTQVLSSQVLPNAAGVQSPPPMHSTHPVVGSQVFAHSWPEQSTLVLHWTHRPMAALQCFADASLQSLSVVQATQRPPVHLVKPAFSPATILDLHSRSPAQGF
jgi:hypothetical protein